MSILIRKDSHSVNEMKDCSGYKVRKTSGSGDYWPELEQQGKAFVGTPGQARAMLCV